MSEFTTYLNHTNKEQFCDWLNNYTQKMGRLNSPEYPYMGDAVYKIFYYDVFRVNKASFPARIRQRPINGEPPPGVIQVNIFDPDENVTYSCWERDMDNTLVLSWLEVGKRLKVTVIHEDAKWIVPPVFQFLWAIKADYPETSDEILPYIIEKADWWKLNLPMPKNNAAIAYIIAEQAREEINKKKQSGIIKAKTVSTDDDLSMPYAKVEILKEPFDILDTTLSHLLELGESKWNNLKFERNIVATAKVKYLLYLDVGIESDRFYLGQIILRKTQDDITEVAIQRMARGERAIPFVEAVSNWKAHIEFDKKVAKEVRKRGQKNSRTNKNNFVPPKQKGRYRLTKEEIKFRKQKVKEAYQIKKTDPQRQWKEIDKEFADMLGISDRTFRSWRHNNY